MSKKRFNEEDREHLSMNRYVTRISDLVQQLKQIKDSRHIVV